MDEDNFGWEFAVVERHLPREYWHTELYYLMSYLVEDIYTQQEIADLMGVDQATVSRWIVRLRQAIKKNDPKRFWAQFLRQQ